MTALISVLITCALVVLVCVVVIWAVELILGALGAPANVALIARVIIILIGLLFIIKALLPFTTSFT